MCDSLSMEMSKVQMHGNENYKSYLWGITLFLKTISLSLFANFYIYDIEECGRTSDACEITGCVTRVTLSHYKINNVICIALKWPIYRDIPRSLFVLYDCSIHVLVVFHQLIKSCLNVHTTTHIYCNITTYFSHVHMNFGVSNETPHAS